MRYKQILHSGAKLLSNLLAKEGHKRVKNMGLRSADRKKQQDQDRQVLMEFLGRMFPGRDVRLKFRTRDRREFNGVWVWDLVTLQHVHKPLKMLKKQWGRDYYFYDSNVVKRTVRWKSILKKLEKLREED